MKSTTQDPDQISQRSARVAGLGLDRRLLAAVSVGEVRFGQRTLGSERC